MKLPNPKFKRQKFLLMFLKLAGGRLSKLELQKLLFLFHQDRSFSFYEFVPYLYGCYSFQANADLEALELQGWIAVKGNNIQLLNNDIEAIESLSDIRSFISAHQDLKGNNLIKTIYRSYPYYAINSKIARSLLSEADLEKVRDEKQKYHEMATTLFTIGYEGISLEAYINQLIRNNIRLLCDVRNNPLSRKFGFSKRMLSTILPKLGILYIHIPELGIASGNRKNLSTPADYVTLFDKYKQTLSEKQSYVIKVLELLHEQKRVALTCFEKDPLFCHRHILSQFIEMKYSVRVVDL